MESAMLERELGNSAEERALLEDGLTRFPSISKLWLMLGHLEERLGNLKQAKEAYGSGLKQCPSCIPLWLSLAELEERMNGLNRARAILTMARKKNARNPELWLAAVEAESRHGNKKEADFLMARALQECPTTEILPTLALRKKITDGGKGFLLPFDRKRRRGEQTTTEGAAMSQKKSPVGAGRGDDAGDDAALWCTCDQIKVNGEQFVGTKELDRKAMHPKS
ncbi:protein STABILIZED1 [Cinnamomum micranthum f. kanehirae]|uniref:Protein STABILIZED1 n=1 Tax=Cinnamomum micranthum f. kanehirae TaxID=337451 RepID=A0A3S3NKW9_9MAGN|nr:protein STABILIZED1 [Cinnamomum micranthum f. kanehirae]